MNEENPQLNEEKKAKVLKYKELLVLVLGGLAGTVLILPYNLTLQKEALEEMMEQTSVTLNALITASIVQNLIILLIVTYLGLYLARKVGLGIPVITGLLKKEKVKDRILAFLKPAIILGLIVGLVIALADVFIFSPLMPEVLRPAREFLPPFWQGLLASFYGGINEEIFLRLFLMSLIVWFFRLIGRSREKPLSRTWMWIAIVVSSLAFGLSHLPALSSLVILTPVVVIRTIVLNGIGGVVFGYLYWKWGLESAMVSHFGADVVLHGMFSLIVV